MGSRALVIYWALSSAALASEPKSTRTQVSADGSRSIRMMQTGEGACLIEVVKETEPEWTLDRCVGTADDLYFINNAGDRFWVLKTLPQKPAKAKKMRPWYSVTVAALYDREGNLLQSRKLSDLLQGRNREAVRQMEKHFKWLEGVLGVPGKGPRVNDRNQVEFETVGTRNVKLTFGAEG